MQDKVIFGWFQSIGHKIAPRKIYGDRTGSNGKISESSLQEHVLGADLERLSLDELAKMFPFAA